MGYAWCDGYVWDMCGVRYANNLLKNPATKRLSGKKVKSPHLPEGGLGWPHVSPESPAAISSWFGWPVACQPINFDINHQRDQRDTVSVWSLIADVIIGIP